PTHQIPTAFNPDTAPTAGTTGLTETGLPLPSPLALNAFLVPGLSTPTTFGFGGVAALSCVFPADAVVGRIILAKNPSSAGADAFGKLCLDACFFSAADGGGPSDGLLLLLLLLPVGAFRETGTSAF
ncbi:hypothetical protein V493_07585, partial [Pseudogymnoascus sp. VKM F-4281 (FW-2241)]